MSEPSATTNCVEQAREAAGRGEWQQAHELLIEADAATPLSGPDLALLAEVAYAAGHLDVTIDAWERAYAQNMRAGDHLAAAGAAVRVAMHLLFDTALMAPVRGWLSRAERLLDGEGETPVHAWLAVVRNYERLLSGDFQALGNGPGAPSRSARSAIRPRPPSARIAEARSLILGGRRVAGPGPSRRGGRGDDVRRTRSALHRARLLRARVCAPGARAVRPGRGMDGGDGAVVPGTADREPPRTLPCPPRRDPQAARLLRRGGEGSPAGLRGASALPAAGTRLAVDRARPHPAAPGRHPGRGRGVPRSSRGRVGSAARPRPGAPGQG